MGRSRGGSKIEAYLVLLPSAEAQQIEDSFFMDGDGTRFVSRDTVSLDHVRIRQLALEAQALEGRIVFGGHTHQLPITEGECHWDIEPKRGTLGCADLLPPLPSPVSKLAGVDSQRGLIVSEMNRLKQEHFQRVRVMKGSKPGRHPPTLKRFEEHRPKSRSGWEPDERFYKLIAIGNEAEIAAECDVSIADALLYSAHVQDLVGSLPPPL